MESEAGEGEAALHLDLTSRTFDPKAYIRRVYADATHEDMEMRLLQTINYEAQNSAVALKELIRDNMGTFIDCKEAMDAMYANDTLLFTGEAVDPIADAFKSTLEDGEKLVAPTVELFEKLRDCKLTKEMLAKLMIVWHVPGVIYECCGVRVAQRQSDIELDHHHHRSKDAVSFEDEGGGDTNSPGSQAGSEDNGTDDGKQSEFISSDTGGSVTRQITRGALEELADGADRSGDYVLLPGEELVYWHGTPLARRLFHHNSHQLHNNNTNSNNNNNRHDRSEGVTEEHSNYEAAVLSLRRAMLYLEENYDLEHATVLGVAACDNDDLDASLDRGLSDVQKKHGNITLTYRYALALLRAALFLNEMMADGLRHAGADDTTLIEDTLSAMMDTAIATVKLRHFCWTVRKTLQLDVSRNVEMLSLQKELNDCGCEKEENDNIPVELSLVSSWSGSYSVTEADSSTTTPTVPSAGASTVEHMKQQQRLEHPVEYYVRITRNQYTQMMEETALCLCNKAKEWRQKFKLNNEMEVKCSDPGNDIVSQLGQPSPFSGTDELMGNLDDSFSLFNTVSLGKTWNVTSAEYSVSDRIKVGGFGVDVVESNELKQAETILEAFCTPEREFARFTTFCIGGVEMTDVLEASAAQLAAYSLGLLRQITESTDASMDISVSAADLSTFTGSFFAACMDHLELVVVSYWSGIAAAVHAGVFDFQPNPDSAFYRMLNGPAVLGTYRAATANVTPTTSATSKKEACVNLNTNISVDDLPCLTYIPVMRKEKPTLRQLSVEMVRRSVKTASDILYALLLSSVNRTFLRGFVYTMATYRISDITREKRGLEEEYVELHAAILVEVILAQWEKTMGYVSSSVRRMKVVIGESCTSSSVVDEAQAEEVGELLEDLEQLRSSLFRCYTHGVGMLAKAYLTLLPSLRSTTTVMGGTSDVSARVSREFVSSVLVNKLLNLLSVVIDRTAPFLQRFDEVYDGTDLFAAKTEGNKEEGTQQQQQQQRLGRRSHPLRRKTPKDVKSSAQLDPVTSLMAKCNCKMVLEHVADQEEMLMALVANLLLVFLDALHYDCQRMSLSTTTFCEMPDAVNIDSLADALCLPTTVVPIVVGELVSPCILQVVASLSLDAKTPEEVRTLLGYKEKHFRDHYTSRVEEHCHLVVDAMFNMLCMMMQQRLTREVRAHGFMMPMMDWQRVSAHTAGAVRPYIADSILLIAQAREGLQFLRQPLLDAAMTQRLVAHFVLTFVTAVTSDGNAFEVSPDCSTNFLTHGLLLIEAEARTILSVADALVDGVVKNSRAGAVQLELNLARELLHNTIVALQSKGDAVCGELATAKAAHSGNFISTNAHGNSTVGDEALTVQQRKVRCEAMVQDAMRRLRSIVEAIITHMDDATITAAFQPLVGSVTESVAERLGKRKEGYRMMHTVQQHTTKKRVKVVVGHESQKTAAANTKMDEARNADDDDGNEEDHKKTTADPGLPPRAMRTKAEMTAEVRGGKEGNGPMTPRTMQRASVFQRATEQKAKRLALTTTTAEPLQTESEGLYTASNHEVHSKPTDTELVGQSRRNRRGMREERASGVNAATARVSRGGNTSRFRRNIAL